LLPELDVGAIRHNCEQRVPPHALDQVRVEADVTERTVTGDGMPRAVARGRGA
jgi:hypothetical protein